MADFFPLASPSDVRAERYNTGFNGATLDGCALDSDGNVVLKNILWVEQLVGTVYTVAGTRGTYWQTQSFTTVNALADLEIQLKLYKVGTPPNPLTVTIRADDGTGKPTGADLGTDTIAAASVGSGEESASFHTFNFTGINLSALAKYHIQVKTTGGDTSNCYAWVSTNSDLYDGGSATQSMDSGSNWTVYSTIEFTFRILMQPDETTSGTVTEDIAVSSLAEWCKYYRKITKPTNTSVTCTIKDTDDNVLIASVADGDSLAAIDAATYKAIRVVHTLERNSITDDTPKLHYREVSWIGDIDAKFLANKTFDTSAPIGSHESNTHLDITGSGYLIGLGQAYSLWAIQIDGGSIYKIRTDGSYHVLFPIRFNESLKVTGGYPPADSFNVWVVLD